MKKLLIVLSAIFMGADGNAQVLNQPEPNINVISQRVIHFMKARQPDSIYALTGTSFRGKITPENFASICQNQIFPMSSFDTVQLVSNVNGINKYKVAGKPALQLLIGLDEFGKVATLLVEPYAPE
jgi:hypothetical protein